MDSCQQDLDIERFGDVVVRSGLEPLQHHLALVPSRQDDHGKVWFPAHDLFAGRHTVECRKHEVHQHKVDVVSKGCLETRPTVVLLQHLVACPAQVVGDEFGYGGVIFHQ